MVKDSEIARLNGELQKFVGSLVSNSISVVLPGESQPTAALSGPTDGKSHELAEQFAEKALRHIYPESAQVRHPRGQQSFPDYQVDGLPIEVKSWRCDRPSSSRRWSGPKFSLFARALEEADPIYLRAVYIELTLGETTPSSGEYLIHMLRAGNLWDFCTGALMGGVGNRHLSPSSAQNPGVSPEDFAKNLSRNAKFEGLSLDGDALLELIHHR